MSISARNNGFGDYQYPKSYVETTTTYYKDGRVTTSQGAHNVLEHRCSRANKTKNLPAIISGTSSKWRSPSTYTRGVFNCRTYSGAWYKEYTGLSYYRQEVEGVPRTISANTQYKIAPIWGGAHQVTLDNNILNEAITQALLKLGDNKAQLGASLGEARKTLNMVAENSIHFLNAYKRLRMGKNPFGKNFYDFKDSRNYSKKYLEFTYGWKPLMSDLKVLYDLFNEQLFGPAHILEGRATVPDNADVDGGQNPRYHSVGTAQRWHRCHLWATVDAQAMRQTAQLGLANPASIAWELTPYSFVLDWFMPIGNVLEAASVPVGLTFLGGYTSVRGEGKVTATLKPTGGWIETSERREEAEFYAYSRTKLTTWPKPLPYAKSTPFNSNVVRNATALFHQLLTRR